MNTVIKTGLCLLVAGCLLGFAGCGKKADTEAPVADVKAQAETMSVEQLRAKAMEYKDAIIAKKADIEKLGAELKKIPITEQLGAEAKALQADIANVNKSLAALTERFQIYYNKLKEKGGNVEGLKI